MGHHGAPRRPAREYVGMRRDHVTICTFDRQPHFLNTDIRERTLLHFRQQATHGGFALSAWCLMPDHLHLLLGGLHRNARLVPFLSLCKQRAADEARRRQDIRLWQPGFHDRVPRSDERLRDVARYIVDNPVRAGLCAAPAEWPGSGSEVWTLDELGA